MPSQRLPGVGTSRSQYGERMWMCAASSAGTRVGVAGVYPRRGNGADVLTRGFARARHGHRERGQSHGQKARQLEQTLHGHTLASAPLESDEGEPPQQSQQQLQQQPRKLGQPSATCLLYTSPSPRDS